MKNVTFYIFHFLVLSEKLKTWQMPLFHGCFIIIHNWAVFAVQIDIFQDRAEGNKCLQYWLQKESRILVCGWPFSRRFNELSTVSVLSMSLILSSLLLKVVVGGETCFLCDSCSNCCWYSSLFLPFTSSPALRFTVINCNWHLLIALTQHFITSLILLLQILYDPPRSDILSLHPWWLLQPFVRHVLHTHTCHCRGQ